MPLKNQDLRSRSSREDILTRLAQMLNGDEKSPTLMSTRDARTVKRKKYTVSVGQPGRPTWICACRVGEKYYTVAIPVHEVHQRANIPIYPLDVLWSTVAYEGTLLRANYYSSDRVKHYLVDEAYCLGGESTSSTLRSQRLRRAGEILDDHCIVTPQYRLEMIKTYQITSSSNMDSLWNLIQADRLDRLRSLIFHPESWKGQPFIYYLTVSDMGGMDLVYQVCYMSPTEQPDVYTLLSLEGEDMGVAAIPDTKTHRACRDMCSGTDRVKVRCRLDNRFGKWVPITLEL